MQYTTHDTILLQYKDTKFDQRKVEENSQILSLDSLYVQFRVVSEAVGALTKHHIPTSLLEQANHHC